MNVLPSTAAFVVGDTTYHCRELPAQFQTSPEHRESQGPRRASQFRTYYASTCGHILSATPDGIARVLKTYGSSNDPKRQKIELRVNSKKMKQYVSRLIAFAFLEEHASADASGNPRNEVNHINGDPSDNRIVNLHWTSQEENRAHYVDHMPKWVEERGL